MNLILDFGNTFIKIAHFEHDKLTHLERIPKENSKQILSIISDLNFRYSIVSAVVVIDAEITHLLKQKSEKHIELNSSCPIPLTNLYETPQSLGNDRIALAVAAKSKYPSSNVLVIDAGSCITLDFISENGEYHGGSIHPGIEMRFKALHQFTEALPQIEFDNQFTKLIGNSTDSSIRAGVQSATIHEISGMINSYEKRYKSLKIIISGGNAYYLSTNLKNSIFADENFLLHGLNQILLYNV
jgi:type III pantothenate kinase